MIEIDEEAVRQSLKGPVYAEFLADVVLLLGIEQPLRDVETVLCRRMTEIDRKIAAIKAEQSRALFLAAVQAREP